MSTQFSTPQETGNNNSEISIYDGDIVQRDQASKLINKLKYAFPDISPQYIVLLTERILDNKFTKKRLEDAVNYCIDNFNYKVPNISNIISYDKKVKIYTYSEILDINHFTQTAFKDYKKVKKTSSGYLYASIVDIQKYNLEAL